MLTLFYSNTATDSENTVLASCVCRSFALHACVLSEMIF